MKTCFSEVKLMKHFGNPLLSKRTPPIFQLTPLSLSNFFMTPLFVRILKTGNPPKFMGGRKLCLLKVAKENLKTGSIDVPRRHLLVQTQ